MTGFQLHAKILPLTILIEHLRENAKAFLNQVAAFACQSFDSFVTNFDAADGHFLGRRSVTVVVTQLQERLFHSAVLFWVSLPEIKCESDPLAQDRIPRSRVRGFYAIG